MLRVVLLYDSAYLLFNNINICYYVKKGVSEEESDIQKLGTDFSNTLYLSIDYHKFILKEYEINGEYYIDVKNHFRDFLEEHPEYLV
jgi:hypothetical protein